MRLIFFFIQMLPFFITNKLSLPNPNEMQPAILTLSTITPAFFQYRSDIPTEMRDTSWKNAIRQYLVSSQLAMIDSVEGDFNGDGSPDILLLAKNTNEVELLSAGVHKKKAGHITQ